MATHSEQRKRIHDFVSFWTGRGYEKGESQKFWLSLLSLLGIETPEQFISFEDKVHLDHTSFIDGFIPTTHVLIEQKSLGKDLRAPIKQSDGTMLNPFQQAKRYAAELPYDDRPRWIVTCNFQEFLVYDMNQPNGEPASIQLKDLERELYRLNFLVHTQDATLQREMEISLAAGELVGRLYDALLLQYIDPTSPQTLHSLNALCVRLVFCLYAEDAGLFASHTAFHDYLASFHPDNVRKGLIELFKMLDTKIEERDPYERPELLAFPYVNGGLFADEGIEIPRFTTEILHLLLNDCSADFDWSGISPTIFGAVFESTLNPETRRSGGMHYTSIENIHKVIDPLFLDSLNAELDEIAAISQPKRRNERLNEYQQRLSELTFLDPACGSGNFLTETFLSLRRLENRTLKLLRGDSREISLGGDFSPIRVSISQFYGIEINDFAATVAKTALWIAESQMMRETEDIVGRDLNFLPLKTYTNITEGNALRLDWRKVVGATTVGATTSPSALNSTSNSYGDGTSPLLQSIKLNYIMGNPPFVGKKEQSKEQKAELTSLFPKVNQSGNLDYVSAWYSKAADFISGTSIRCCFVSTNSITQGEQVPILWKYLFAKGIHIDFAYRPFVWDSEADIKAHVHCVIIGFSTAPTSHSAKLYTDASVYKTVTAINPYLIDAPAIFIESRQKPICQVPPMSYGSMPIDNGYLSLTEDDVNALLQESADNAKFIRPYAGGVELIRGTQKWCLWLKDANPVELQRSKFIMDRIEKTEAFRRSSGRPQTLALADTPYLFGEIRQPATNMLVVPKVSSEKRRYIPISFVSPETIISGSALIVPDATLYDFGVLISNVHMAWMRTVCGRLEMRYQYSGSIVYNNFPWPAPTAEQRERIEATAQAILDARKEYSGATLANMYDKMTLYTSLLKAHQQNDRAVMAAYGFPVKDFTESDCVARLMQMYKEMTK